MINEQQGDSRFLVHLWHRVHQIDLKIILATI